MNSKEKFREVVDAFLSEMYVTEITNQCTRINIEEKIELLQELIFQTGDDINMWDDEKEPYPIERIIKAMSNQCAELTNELKQLEK